MGKEVSDDLVGTQPTALEDLVEALRCLPGVGPRSAQRMAFHLLQRDKPGASRLAQSLGNAVSLIRHCERCNSFTQTALCGVCASPRRDQRLARATVPPALPQRHWRLRMRKANSRLA